MEGVRGIVPLIVLAGALGCAKAPDAPFPDWVEESRLAGRASDAAAQRLLKAAHAAEREAGGHLTWVSFKPGQKTELIERLASASDEAIAAARQDPVLLNRVGRPFEILEGQPGLRLIGRTLAWRVDRHVAQEEFSSAVAVAVDAVRLGYALGSGSATDAALGLSIADEARLALAPALGRLSPAELRTLGTGLEAALKHRPSPKLMLENERFAMLGAVQYVQDAFRGHKLGTILDELGRDVQPAIDFLEGLRSGPSRERAAYFSGFADEAKLWFDHYDLAFRRNARQREGKPGPELAKERPWRRISRHFFHTLEPLIRQREASICRTRLLALHAILLAETKTNGEAPGTLVGLSDELKTDPFSGQPFLYRPEGSRFLAYSVGVDLRDDGGETDEAFWAPDVRVESDGS